MTEQRYQLHLGDCLETLKTLPDNSIDAVVCDPPYGLSSDPDMAEVLKHWLAGDDYTHRSAGFMGKTWDSFVPGPSVWRECLRVLKPGGHLLAFAGTRTQDLMALSIRLGGFEIRDSIDWMHDGSEDALNFVDSLTPAQRDAFYRLQDQGDARWTWAYGSGFPKSMDVSKAIDKAAGAEREIVGLKANYHSEGKRSGSGVSQHGVADGSFSNPDLAAMITAPATEAAKQWAGWGTALKPAHEPVVVARKPFTGTVAANVLEFGTGAINVDGCRVGTESTRRPINNIRVHGGADGAYVGQVGNRPCDGRMGGSEAGRWPANLIHDGSDEVVALFPSSESPWIGNPNQGAKGGKMFGGSQQSISEKPEYRDAGSAARFFYCAKTSRKDRNEGLEDPGPQFTRGTTLRQVENTETKGNTHPTVKPTDLMAYLCRLVTPPGGTVLDPFMGSGSTGKAAMREGFRFIGCELDAGYLEIARKRIAYECDKGAPKAAEPQADMFEECAQ